MRCPDCGARNPDSAAWCTQCYATFADGEDPAPEADDVDGTTGTGPAGTDVAGGREVDAPVEVRPVAPAAASAPDAGAAGSAGGTDEAGEVVAEAHGEGFRSTDDGLEWRCAVCSSWNPLETSTCAVCDAPFGRSVADGTDDVVDRDTSTVLVLSAVLPGAGHVALGRTVDGVVRAVMYVLWLAGALALLRAAAGTPTPALPAAPLGIGALALWVLSALDAVSLAEGSRDQLLTPRVFLWLVVGVVGALIAAFIPGMLQITDLGDA